MTDDQIIKTYVWHGEQCYFVSTIERDSSAMEGPQRFNETLVWLYDWKNSKRGEWVHQDGCMKGSIGTHQYIVNKLFRGGLEALREDA